MGVHRRHDVGPRLVNGGVDVVGGRARFVFGGHHLIAIDIVFDDVGRSDLFHEDVLGLDQKMIGLAGYTHRDMVVGHVDRHKMRNQPVRGSKLAAQLPLFIRDAFAQQLRLLLPAPCVNSHRSCLTIFNRRTLTWCVNRRAPQGAHLPP